MDHVAILKKEWGLVPKILSGDKTLESRWLKRRAAPWDKVQPGDTLYFKNAGEPVIARATVTKVLQYEIRSHQEALALMRRYAEKDLGEKTLPGAILNYIKGKRFTVFVFFDSAKKIQPFKINKRGFGLRCAWMTTRKALARGPLAYQSRAGR